MSLSAGGSVFEGLLVCLVLSGCSLWWLRFGCVFTGVCALVVFLLGFWVLGVLVVWCLGVGFLP